MQTGFLDRIFTQPNLEITKPRVSDVVEGGEDEVEDVELEKEEEDDDKVKYKEELSGFVVTFFSSSEETPLKCKLNGDHDQELKKKIYING